MIDENVLVQIGLVAVTASLAIITWIKMSESNRTIRNEFEARFRPVLARMYMDIPNRDLTVMLKEKKIPFRIINNGASSAIKVSKQYYVVIRQNGRESHLKSSDAVNPDGILISSLAPNESMGVDVELDDVHIEQALFANTVNFGLIIFYHDVRNKKYSYRMEGYLDRGSVILHPTTQMD